MPLYLKRILSKIGEIRIYADDTNVVGLLMANEVHKGSDQELCFVKSGQNEILIQAAEELKSFFSGNLQEFSVPVRVSGTNFQKAVWKTLRTVEYGQLQTYADVARAIGNPMAVRAVGRAIGSNPVPIIIPCHRVIGSDASLTGFGGGLATKQVLLEMEGHTIINLKIRNNNRLSRQYQ